MKISSNKGFTITDAMADALDTISRGHAGDSTMCVHPEALKPAVLKKLLALKLAEHSVTVSTPQGSRPTIIMTETGFRVWQLTYWAGRLACEGVAE